MTAGNESGKDTARITDEDQISGSEGESATENEILPVRKAAEEASCGVEVLDWGIICFAHRAWKGLEAELLQVYAREDVEMIACMAILRAAYPGITNDSLKRAYENSVLHFIFPNVPLGRNTVVSFLRALGQRFSQMIGFTRVRTADIKEFEQIVLDGTLTSGESRMNRYLAQFRETKGNEIQDDSILMLYNADRKEPVCNTCYAGYIPDSDNFPRFLADHNVTAGILTGDQEFLNPCAKAWFEEHAKLHYLLPLRKNSEYIGKHNLHTCTNLLPGHDGIMFRKVYDGDDKVWLYSYRNVLATSRQKTDWDRDEKLSGGTPPDGVCSSGGLALISDLEFAPEKAYEMHIGRLGVENAARLCKMDLDFDRVRVHSDASACGSHFVNFIAHIVNTRMYHQLSEAGVLNDMDTFQDAKETLRRARIVQPDSTKPWGIRKLSTEEYSVLRKTGLMKGNSFPPYDKIPAVAFSL